MDRESYTNAETDLDYSSDSQDGPLITCKKAQ